MKKLFLFFFILFMGLPSAFCKIGYIGLAPQASLMKRADAETDYWTFGGAARINFLMLGAEASIGYASEELADNVKATTMPVTVSGLFYPMPFLYIMGGMGWHNTSVTWKIDQIDNAKTEIDNKDSESTTGAHAGFGVELPFGTNARLSADIRYFFQDYELKDLAVMQDYDYNYYTINFSLFFLL